MIEWTGRYCGKEERGIRRRIIEQVKEIYEYTVNVGLHSKSRRKSLESVLDREGGETGLPVESITVRDFAGRHRGRDEERTSWRNKSGKGKHLDAGIRR